MIDDLTFYGRVSQQVLSGTPGIFSIKIKPISSIQ
jgi:hypothetical protein